MDYKIGSLADIISGSEKLKSRSHQEGIFQNAMFSHSSDVKFREISKIRKDKRFKKPKRKQRFSVEKCSDEKIVKKTAKRKIAECSVQSSEIDKRFQGPKKKRKFFVENNEEEFLNESNLVVMKKTDEFLTPRQQNIRNAEMRIKRAKKPPHTRDPERESRTIFVGNVPYSMSPKVLKKHFMAFGKVESVRLRSAALADPRVPKREAVIRRKFHPDRSNITAYVRFTTREMAQEAVTFSGTVWDGHHIQIDMAEQDKNHDQKKAIFVGNVPFAAEEDHLRKVFIDCGKILNIRIVRDKETGIGKGFAYVNFDSTDAVELALKLDGQTLKKRPLRVKRAVKKPVQPSPVIRNPRMKMKLGKSQLKKKESFSEKGSSVKTKKIKKKVRDIERNKGFEFQGQKTSDIKKSKALPTASTLDTHSITKQKTYSKPSIKRQSLALGKQGKKLDKPQFKRKWKIDVKGSRFNEEEAKVSNSKLEFQGHTTSENGKLRKRKKKKMSKYSLKKKAIAEIVSKGT